MEIKKSYIAITVIISLLAGLNVALIDFNIPKLGESGLPSNKKSITIASVADKLSKSAIKSKYTLNGNTIKTVAKDNPKDKIEVSIGRKTKDNLLGATDVIEPILNISRWDDEVSISIEKDVSTVAMKDRDVSFVDDKIIYDTPLEEYNFYGVEPTVDLPEGAYEFEVILKEKPASNVVKFTIETNGLDFFYQPEIEDKEIEGYEKLTPEELLAKKREMRPENVVGSYAVYASGNKVNYVGGKEYKAGKVGHIYRPQIEDAIGNKVWGELSIDVVNGLLAVTIPQDFLDKAVYPVRHAAGLTFGYTSVGGSFITIGYSAIIAGNGNGTLGAEGTVSSMSFYGYGVVSKTSYIQLGMYTKDSPYSYVANTYAITVNNATQEWKTSNLISPTACSSIYYHLVYYRSAFSSSNYIYGAYDTTTGLDVWGKNDTYPTWPSTIADAYSGSIRQFSIYATYTAEGGTAPETSKSEPVIFN